MVKRSPDDIDPKRTDVAAQPRRRRVRAKVEAPEELKAKKGKLRQAALKRPRAPAVMFESDGEGDVKIASPYSDTDLFELALANTLATRSLPVMRMLTREIGDLCRVDYDPVANCLKPNETDMAAALAIVADAQPRTTGEAMLVVQAVAMHLIAMRLSTQALNSGAMVSSADAALASKLAGRYASHIETLAALRGKQRTARQSIKVTKELHQHVHYHRGEAHQGSQAHEPSAEAPDKCTAVRGEEPRGQVLSLPLPTREKQVPPARRG